MARAETLAGGKKKTRSQESEEWERAEIERLKKSGVIPVSVSFQRK